MLDLIREILQSFALITIIAYFVYKQYKIYQAAKAYQQYMLNMSKIIPVTRADSNLGAVPDRTVH